MRELLSLDREVLGEACGIFACDGSLYRTQRSFVAEVRAAESESEYYVRIVLPLFEGLTGRKLRLTARKYEGGRILCIRACGREAFRIFHTFLQFPIGRKSGAVRMPKIIRNNHECWKAYVRGVFDAGGSVYLRRTGKKYRNPAVEIYSPSVPHLTELREVLAESGFAFWLEKRNLKIRMAGRKNLERFFKEVSPHNNTKLERFAEIMRTGKP